MDLDELLRCLVEAESGELREELTGGRYAVVQYDPDEWTFTESDLAELFGAPASADAEETDEDDWDEDEDGASFDVIGVATSVYEALDLLGEGLPDEEELTELDEEEWAEEAAEFGADALGEDQDASIALLQGLQDPRRRAVAQLLCGVLGPMDFLTEEFEQDPYLGHVAARLPGARFVMLASAAPPHQEVAYAILELPPRGTPDPAAHALLRAAASGDLAALRTAIGEGTDVDTLDECGRAPLHHAVAARTPAAVGALLAAGADPRAQSAFGNAPQFATAARRTDDEEHWSILWSLLDAGADINAANTSGQTLLDLAIRSDPYPEPQIRLLLDRGAVSRELANTRVDSLVSRLPYRDDDLLRILRNQVGFLLATGAPYDHPLDAMLGSTGYYERELSADYLVGLVDLMLTHGVRDRPGTYGRTARESAQHHVAHGLTHYQAVADRLAN
ncbi:ankyrin repeat domain-containing protein [Streptomyces sp. RTd22]|uniref:ankyrin repeat domain-containing protein n=1 Tax=Streptomyces sp. RTd22 TaxID=1841249 RepID=UPI0007C4792A|nr:ankyrin repeat domain-containing protein [Streptomyces sp. RTd22]